MSSVLAHPAYEMVVADVTVQGVVACKAEKEIGTEPTIERVGGARAIDAIVARPTLRILEAGDRVLEASGDVIARGRIGGDCRGARIAQGE